MQLRASDRTDWVRLQSLLSIGWTVGVALVFLIRYDAWQWPVQFMQLAAAAAPTFAIGPHFMEFMAWRFADAFCLAGIVAAASALGALVVERFTTRRDLLARLLALGVGFWIIAMAVLVVGTLSAAKTPWVFLGLLGWAWPAPRRFWGAKTDSAGTPFRLDGWSTTMLVLIVGAALLNLPGAMAPPFEYDELEYHLGAPAEYLRAGKIAFLPHNFYSNLPQLTEMLYLLAMATTSDIAAKLLHWLFGILAALAVYAVATRLWSRRIGLTAAALFYCVPFVQDLGQTARIDLATTFFAALAFGALLTEEWRLAALATGCAVATKWTAIPVVVLPALAFMVLSSKSLRRCFSFSILVLLPVLPWLVKNWLLTGNPVYPLFNWLFASPYWSVEQAAVFARRHYPFFGLGTPVEFFERAWHYSFSEPMAVPLLLMAAPLVFLVRPMDRNVRRGGWLFVAAYAAWFLLTFRPWRFLLPAFPLAALVGGYALCHVGKWARVAVCIVWAVGLTWMGSVTLVDVGDYKRIPPRMSFLHFALGQVSREEFVSEMGGGMYEPIMWMNQNLPASAKVLYVGEARVYYARHSAVWSTAFDRHPLTEGWDQLRARGITHVYVNHYEWQRLKRGYDYLARLDEVAWNNFLRQQADPIHVAGPCVVYRLRD